MKGEVIIVDVRTDGTLHADVAKGPGGKGCLKELLALLDGVLGDDEPIHTKSDVLRVGATTATKAKVGQ